jgi:hypothetical protein
MQPGRKCPSECPYQRLGQASVAPRVLQALAMALLMAPFIRLSLR